MRLGLGLGISYGGGGGVGPYATSLAAYDFTSPSGYVLNTGRVETLVDLSPNGRNLGQTTAGDRPTVGTMTDGKTAGVYTNAEEWNFTDDAALSTLLNNAATADFSITITFERTGITTQQALIAWYDPATTVNEMTIGFSSTDRIRISREDAVPTTNTVDTPLAYTATGVTNILTVNFSGGLVSIIINGLEVVTDVAFAAGTPTIAATRMAIGTKAQPSPIQGFEGFIHSVVIG
jgi:hypothetical protein